MKTAEEWTNHLDFALFERMTGGNADPLLWSSTVKIIHDAQLDSYRAGMEAAARMCEQYGDTIGQGKVELNDAEMNTQEGCYNCGKMLKDAAKTAQLPTAQQP